jgi:hypothetical protein
MARSAFLAGRTLADVCRSVLALAFIIGLGLLVGFRFHGSVGACLAGVALIIAFGYAFTWVYAAIGLAVKDPQTAQMASILPMFILFFASSALVPVSTMPGWLQPFAQNQPATLTINAVRALFEGGPRLPRPVAGSSVVRRNLRRLPGHLAESLPEGHSLTQVPGQSPWRRTRSGLALRQVDLPCAVPGGTTLNGGGYSIQAV